MKQLIITIAALLLLPLAVMAQYEEDTENGVVSLNGKEGFTIATKKGDFVFKPYMLVQILLQCLQLLQSGLRLYL